MTAHDMVPKSCLTDSKKTPSALKNRLIFETHHHCHEGKGDLKTATPPSRKGKPAMIRVTILLDFRDICATEVSFT